MAQEFTFLDYVELWGTVYTALFSSTNQKRYLEIDSAYID